MYWPSYQYRAAMFCPCTVTVLDQAVRPPEAEKQSVSQSVSQYSTTVVHVNVGEGVCSTAAARPSVDNTQPIMKKFQSVMRCWPDRECRRTSAVGDNIEDRLW